MPKQKKTKVRDMKPSKDAKGGTKQIPSNVHKLPQGPHKVPQFTRHPLN